MTTAPARTAEFQITHLAKASGLMLGVLALFGGVMHFGAALRWWPAPRPTLDMDRTILIHQAEATLRPQDAEVIFIGDSSCMMDVAARELGRALSQKVLNLGTLSYLDLPAFAEMIHHYDLANPQRLRMVVLLCHPEFLRRHEPVAAQVQTLKNFYAGEDFCDTATWRAQLKWWLGLDVFRGRILSRIVPMPLPRDFSRFYGFSNRELSRYLSEQRGSAVDPRRFLQQTGQGNAEYRLASKLEADSAAFRSALPKGVRLFVGITPAPRSFVPPGYEQRHQQMLAEWSRWLRADAALTNLQGAMTDENFATTTHLNEAGARAYTELLARSLESIRTTSATAKSQTQP